MRKHRNPIIRAYADGAAFETACPPGQQDAGLQSACSAAAFMGGVPVDEFVEASRPVAAAIAEGRSDTSVERELEKIRDKYSRALREKREKDEAQAAQDASLRPVFFRDPSPSDDDHARWAAERSRPREQLMKELVVQAGRSFYVFVDGAYKSPITREELDVSLPRDLADAPVRWVKYDDKGNPKKRTTSDILSEHCTVARAVVADLAIQQSWYDSAAQEFNEAVRPLRPLEARFSVDVEAWLSHLAGAQLPLLLDWIALLTRLDRQLAALYLQGPKSTGKTLLAYGLARLWCKGPPADVASAMADFNDDLVRCPLVLADEEIPQKFKFERASAKIRALIGQESRVLRRKYLPAAHLRGAVRLMLCANHSRMLDMSAEDVDEADIDAIAERVAYVVTPQSAADYLEQIGGPKTVQGWIDDDVIAEHALWLRDTRAVAGDHRFGVRSNYRDAHEDMATHGKAAAQVVEWLAAYLNAPITEVCQKSPVFAGDGHLYVNAATIQEFWDRYVKHHAPPSTDLIGRKLSGVSRGTRRIRGRRYHDVRLDVVFRWADRVLGADVAGMQRFVDRPLKIAEDGDVVDTMRHDA